MIICVTGTPGTGKSTLSKELAKRVKGKYINGNLLIRKHRLSEGKDKKRDCLIIDPTRFNDAVLKECSNQTIIYIIDSHLSQNISPNQIELCIVCKTPLKILHKRLSKRKYLPLKVRENLDAEIFDVCLTESIEIGHVPVIYTGHKDIKKLVMLIQQRFDNLRIK